MKRLLSLMVATLVLVVAVGALAAGQKAAPASKAASAAKTATLKGEIVDMGCYVGHGAMGASHKGCATKCLAGGMPMGLLTADGKLYLLTLDHDNADPYNKCKDMASEVVQVSGAVSQRNGVMAIDVIDVKPAK